MTSKLSARASSQDANSLTDRIAANGKFGSADLTGWLIEHLAPDPHETLLDVGCGTGVHLLKFASAIGTRDACTGIDISLPSLNVARDAAAASGLSLRLERLAMEELDQLAAPRRFRLITCIYALYYSQDVVGTLNQMRALLPEDGSGRIAIMGPYRDNNAEWFRFIGQFMTLPDRVRESTTTFMFDPVLRFATTHFGKISCRRFVNNVVIPSMGELERYWRSNVYYEEQYDDAFREFASRHFAQSDSFKYSKVGQLVVMESPIDGESARQQ